MPPSTFHDIRAFRRCPYAYRQDRIAGTWRTTIGECMDLSVRDAVFFASGRRAMGLPTDVDSALSVYWESWDRHFDDVANPPVDNLELIRYGEQCVRNHIHISESCSDRIVAAGASEILELPGGDVLVSMDGIGRRGTTAVVTQCVTGPVILPTAELSKDYEARLGALWALDNIPGCDRVVMRWELLGPGTAVECSARRPSLNEASKEVSDILRDMADKKEVLPRESDYCLECPYSKDCPRRLHEIFLSGDPDAMTADEGVALVDELAGINEKIRALNNRRESLETRRAAIEAKLVSYADSHGYMSVCGRTHKALVRHEVKVVLPEDKTELVRHLKDIGRYDDISMVNYPRLRSEIAKGNADPGTMKMADVVPLNKVYLRSRPDRKES